MSTDSRTVHLEERAYLAFSQMREQRGLGVSQAIELLLSSATQLPLARIGVGGRVKNIDPLKLSNLIRSWIGTQEALAEHVGVTQKAISDWAVCRTLPRSESFNALLELFGIDEGELLCDPSAQTWTMEIPLSIHSLNRQSTNKGAARFVYGRQKRDFIMCLASDAIRRWGKKPQHEEKFAMVKLTRLIGTRGRLMDYDNLVGGAKPVLDALKVLGMVKDDSPKWIKVDYQQKKYNKHATRIEITYGDAQEA